MAQQTIDETKTTPSDEGDFFPWRTQSDKTACNFAFGHLVNNLERRLTVDGRLHAETLVAAAGAIAGFAALSAFFDQVAQKSAPTADQEIQIATTKSGAKFYFGEPIDRTLFPMNQEEAPRKLWSVASGGAMAAGIPQADLPELGAMFSHVTTSLGGELEGLPSLARENHPKLPAKELLKIVWPLAVTCFKGKFPGVEQEFGEAEIASWPVIAAYAANIFIQKVNPVLSADKSLAIVIETAIYASKLSPESLQSTAG